MIDFDTNTQPYEASAWRSRLKKAIRTNKRDAHNRYFQLATVGLDDGPRNRTVVFRGFDECCESGEGEELTQSPTAPKNFLVLIFEPTRIDYLLLRTPQIRIISAYYNGLLSEQPVNP